MTRQRGVSLVELIMFIVIVSVALAGILLVMNVTTRGSADPLIHKQSLAIAESILEEIELMPFTFCDPDDPAAGLSTTVDATACAGGAGGPNDESVTIGPEGAGSVGGGPEGRYAVPQFDNVSDYHGFFMNAGSILDIGMNNTGVNGYTLEAIQITPTAIPTAPVVPVSESLWIRVSVRGPDGVAVVLDGIRTRYAPRAVP